MATRKIIRFGYDDKHLVFSYGSTFNQLALTPHKIFTVDFQTGVPKQIIAGVIDQLSKAINPKFDKPRFTKVHRSIRPVQLTDDETKQLAKTETTLKALQEQRDYMHDRILIIGSEKFYKERAMLREDPEKELLHVSHEKGVFITCKKPEVEGNACDMYRIKCMHTLEGNILKSKHQIAVPDNPFLSRAIIVSKVVRAITDFHDSL